MIRNTFVMVAIPLLLFSAFDGSLSPFTPRVLVLAFPASATTQSMTEPGTSANSSFSGSTTVNIGGITEYPVFMSVTDEIPNSETNSSDSEVATEAYMIIENQEVDYDDEDSSSTGPSIVRSTTPMPSPKSSPQQEAVLRELKKLWDLSEGMDESGNDALKHSLSSIVNLAYARVYMESDETLHRLKSLLQQLQARILLGTDLHDGGSLSTTKASSLQTNYPTATSYPENLQVTSTGATIPISNAETMTKPNVRRKRSIYSGNDHNDVEAIFFANVNSEENLLIPEDKNRYHQQQAVPHLKSQGNVEPQNNKPNFPIVHNSVVNSKPKNDSIANLPIEEHTDVDVNLTLLPENIVSSSLPQKIVRINDRKKPMPSFYLSKERIEELKRRATSTSLPSTMTTTSTLSPLSILIQDELENEVNLLQQHENVENYDIHISSSTPETLVPLTTATPVRLSPHIRPLSGDSHISLVPSSTQLPFTAEDIALALFNLLRPDTFEEDEEESEDEQTTLQPHPKPANILYQVGSLSSVLNFTIAAKNASSLTTKQPSVMTTRKPPLAATITPASVVSTTLSFVKLKEKYSTKSKNNTTIFVPIPTALADLGLANSTTNSNASVSTTSTERATSIENNEVYDYTDVVDQTSVATDQSQQSITSSIMQGTQDSMQTIVDAVSRLSVGAKMVLLFSVSISVLSIGIGLYALGPPLAAVGVLGVIIPVALLLIFETSATGKRKLTLRQKEQLLISKLHSQEFSKIIDMIFEAAAKYSKG